jgi:hypothetical protein
MSLPFTALRWQLSLQNKQYRLQGCAGWPGSILVTKASLSISTGQGFTWNDELNFTITIDKPFHFTSCALHSL